MFSFVGYEPTESEFNRFVLLLGEEVVASRMTERIIYESRKKDRDHFTVLHRALRLE